MPFGTRLLLSAAIGSLIIFIALAPSGPRIYRLALNAQPHLPDLKLFAHLPLAIQLHILGALGAILLGAALMWLRKGRILHRAGGWTWVGLVALVAGSSMFIRGANGGGLSILHLLTGWTLITLPLAVLWAKRHQVQRHRRAMMGLFYGGFVINLAFAFIPGRTMWQLFFG
ncbi:hypothetical protein DJ018_05790 [Phenylobacterium deserti]|uniref:DUF2306 domain-containing protein n=2 Tax=Phenylobacterium deserti TaxID=1914756 RepID=A0A328AT60_9CAUL|nr:hypothetical protein DJ018_05790 [Phenylobacterium deserti]